jgi:hypothetical protein
MNVKTWAGLVLLAGSYAQLLLPSRLFAPPFDAVWGFPVVPGVLLAVSATLFTLGVILIGEGLCQRFGGPSLWSLATSDPARFGRIIVAAAAAGLVMEVVAQWLGRLWRYPYWTVWFYALVVLPGFAFYWLSIAESYLAAKAVLDVITRPRRVDAGARLPSGALGVAGVLGILALAAAAWLYLRWYAAVGGYALAVARPTTHAPPFGYALLAFLGVWVTVEWLLHRRRRPSLVEAIARGYWVPIAAIAAASAVLSVVMETQNALYRHWAYQNFPWAGSEIAGVPVSVFATWPLQYVVFLLLPSLAVRELAKLFWLGT